MPCAYPMHTKHLLCIHPAHTYQSSTKQLRVLLLCPTKMADILYSRGTTLETFVYNSILLTGLEFNCTMRDFLVHSTGSSWTSMSFEIVYKSFYYFSCHNLSWSVCHCPLKNEKQTLLPNRVTLLNPISGVPHYS